jgi:hypothetical protein
MPGSKDEDLVKDQAHLEQTPEGAESVGVQVPVLLHRARGCCDDKLIGMILLGRRTSLMTMKKCRLCGTTL